MSARVTMSEIAEALGVSRQAVSLRAKRESWPYVEEAVRGGRLRTFAPADIPAGVRAALKAQAKARQAQALSAAITELSAAAGSSSLPAAVLPAGASPSASAVPFSQLNDEVENDGSGGQAGSLGRRVHGDRSGSDDLSTTAADEGGHGQAGYGGAGAGVALACQGERENSAVAGAVRTGSGGAAGTGAGARTGRPGLPTDSGRENRLRADRERGGGRELVGGDAGEHRLPARNAGRGQLVDGSTTQERDLERARGRVLDALAKLQADTGCSQEAALTTLITTARGGMLPAVVVAGLRMARDKRGRKGAIDDGLPSVRSLKRWLALDRAGESLQAKKPEGDTEVKPWYGLAVALKQRPQKPTTTWVHKQIVAQWQAEWGAEPPSYDVVAHFFREKFSRLDVLRGQHQGSALRQHMFYQHRSAAGLAPFVEVHADGWNTHFTAPHPVTGEFVTYEVWHFHDVATRYVPPPSIGLSESFDVIAKGLELCVRVGGVMAVWQTDSTGSVKNDRMKLDPVASIAERAGIEIVHPQTVGNSQANGICENFNTYLDREARELATYQHPRMDSLAHRRVKKITEKMVKAARAGDLAARDQFKAEAAKAGAGLVFDSFDHARLWILEKVEKFNHTPHSSLPKISDPVTGKRRHQTPAEALAEARDAGWQPVLLDEPDIIDLFRPHLRKKVSRECVSPFGGQRYTHADLGHFNGQEVMVAVDIMDGASVWVKDLQGRLICEARFVEATGYRCDSMYEHALEKRARAQIRRKENQIDSIAERMAPAALDAPAEPVIDVAMQLYGDLVEPAPVALPAATPAAPEARPVTARRHNDITDVAMYLYGDQIDEESEQEKTESEVAAG